MGTNINDAIIPKLPACGTIFAPQIKKSIKQIVSPPTEAAIAPVLLTFLLNNPQINGPKKTEAIAPQEIDRIVTITAGFNIAKSIDKSMKKILAIRISFVRDLSVAFFRIKPL